MNSSIFVNICSIVVTVFALIILTNMNANMCNALSWKRIFTINSTVCNTISMGERMLEKAFTSLILSFAYNLIHYFKGKMNKECSVKKD